VGWEGNAWLRSGDLAVRLQEAKDAGFNALSALNWWVPDLERDWWYCLKTATPPDGTSVGQVVAQGLSKPVLSYGFHHEFHGMTSDMTDWQTLCGRSKSAGSLSLCGDLVMILAGYQNPGPYDVFEHPVPEYTISEFTPESAISRIYDDLLTQQSAWDLGRRFVRSASITVVAEFASFISGCQPRVPTLAEIRRAFLLCAAMNVKHFDVLWGANQNITGCTTVETLRPQIDQAWRNTLFVVQLLRSESSLLLDPSPWVRVDATPGLQPPSQQTGWVWSGVAAFHKAGRYIIVNFDNNSHSYSVVGGPSGTIPARDALLVNYPTAG
jgi:hypothetical protein